MHSCFQQAGIPIPLRAVSCFQQAVCRERDSNPHDRFGSRDFKSLVSTNSTIAAAIMVCLVKRMQRY